MRATAPVALGQQGLIEILSRTIKDGRVVSLIHKYLRSGVIIHGVFVCETR